MAHGLAFPLSSPGLVSASLSPTRSVLDAAPMNRTCVDQHGSSLAKVMPQAERTFHVTMHNCWFFFFPSLWKLICVPSHSFMSPQTKIHSDELSPVPEVLFHCHYQKLKGTEVLRLRRAFPLCVGNSLVVSRLIVS